MNYTEPPRSMEYIRERCECDDCWEWKLSAKKGRLPRLFIRARNEAGEVEYDQMSVRYLVYWHKHGRQPVVGKKHVLSMNCGNELCVNPDHLRLTPRSEVSKKVASRGGYQTKVYRRKIAEASRRRSKLSDEAVAAIREAADAKAKDLAGQYGISEAYVYMLRRGEWRQSFEQVTPFTGLGARAWTWPADATGSAQVPRIPPPNQRGASRSSSPGSHLSAAGKDGFQVNLCTRCGRKLKRPSPSGMGPVCLIAVLGRKERKQASEVKRDELTPDLFPMHAVSAFAVEQGL